VSYTNAPTVAPNSTTSPELQAWATIVEAAFTGSGWTVTSDTGQTAPGSLVAPGLSSDNFTQYRIYAMADALQATKPVFVKVGYGAANGGFYLGTPGIQVSIGTSTSGTGILTGILSDVITLAAPNIDASPRQCYACGDTNRIHIMMWSDPSFVSGKDAVFFSIERTKNNTGSDTGDGLHYFWVTTDGRGSFTNHADTPVQCGFEVLPFDSTPKVLISPWVVPASPLGSLQNSTDSTVGVLFPVPVGYQPYVPGLGLLCYQGSDFSPYATVAIPDVLSATHTYRVMSQTSSLGGRPYNSGPPTNVHFMMRWE
jgi:hypothetical protein